MNPGDKIGAYEIVALLGKGGMGEVYRARDAKLNRDVAIKVLPSALANDAVYRARFEREARVLAALNHPNIAAIHALEGNAIVMELVEGDSPRGPMPVAEALPIARQIAEALEAAHEKAIVHRDLKPGNVKVTADGVVKVLDFGLAKEIVEKPTVLGPNAATLTIRPTESGLILGTAPYMSPEQAAGKPIDRRADIWAYGVVLYELLTGRCLFQGDAIAGVLAEVMRKEIELSDLPRETPPAIRELLRRCLDRNLRNRLRDIGEARIAIDNIGSRPAAVQAPRPRWPLAVAGVLAAGLIAVAYLHFTRKTPEPPLRSFSFTPEDLPVWAPFRRAAISPDGRNIAYVAGNKLWLRPLASETAHSLQNTEGAEAPFWSPDSSQLGFVAGGELKKVSLSGGIPVTVAKLPGYGRGGSWSPDGKTVLVAIASLGILEVAANGGNMRMVCRGLFSSPAHLPSTGGKRMAIAASGALSRQSLDLVDLDTGETTLLRSPGTAPAWSPDGYVLYQAGPQTPGLQAWRLSPRDRKGMGEPLPVLGGGADFSASFDGTLLWVEDANLHLRRLVWRDRSGKILDGIDLTAASFLRGVSLSPDGTRAAYVADDQGNEDVWVADLRRGARMRLTFSPARDTYPVWSPQGHEIAFASERQDNYDVFVQPSTGGYPRVVMASGLRETPEAWSPDGKTLLIARLDPKTAFDLWSVRRRPDGTFEAPSIWLQTPANEWNAAFSPDGKYVAYDSDETGRFEVYVRPSGGGGSQWQVSANGGTDLRWSRDSKEIFYQQGELLLSAPVIAADGGVSVGRPVELFRTRNILAGTRSWDADSIGQRFLIAESVESGVKPPSIHIIENWRALLRERNAQ